MPARVLRAAIAAIAVAAVIGVPAASTVLALAPKAAPAAASFPDTHFREYPVFTGLTHPVTLRFASDGRAFVAEKEGVVKAYDSLADTTPTVVADLRSSVNSYWDRGMLGLAVDPQFLAGRPYLYVYYVYDAPPGKSAPYWNDLCPNPPGSTVDGCAVTARIDRIEVDPATNVEKPGTRVNLVADWCQQFPSHSGGGIAIGADGQLWFSGGEGAAFSGGADYGQRGGTLPDPVNPITPVNPCGDPVTVTSAPGSAPVVDAKSAEGGSLRSQDVRTTGDPTGVDGALIRIDPDTGAASAGNPLAGVAGVDANARRIVAHGLRNPFRLTFRPGTSEVYVGDVGNATWEEIERIVPPSGARTATTLPNFGWPCYEGPGQQSPWATMGNTLCDGVYAQAGATTAPLYAYNHTGTAAPCGVSGWSGAAISGLAFYDAAAADLTVYPGKYDGALFFVDYSRNCLAALLPGPDGTPDPATMEVVATGLGHPVDLVTGPHGDLYYADLDGGRIVRIRHVVAPVAVATATPDTALAPVTVHLDGSASTDPDPAAGLVSWQWDLDHDGVFDGAGDASGATLDWAITTPAIYPVTLKVTSSNGLSDTTELVVDATDDPPVPSIALPGGDLTWSVGDEIAFSGSATDPQDGDLPAAALSWELVMQHCTDVDCHEHIVETQSGVASGSFIAPDHEYPSHLELRLTATDSHGAMRRTAVALYPKTTTLALDSVPAGVSLSVDGTSKPSPSVTTLIRGGSTTVSAPAAAAIDGKRYRFSQWSNGQPRMTDVAVTDPASLVATFVPDVPDACLSATPVAKDTWVQDRASADGDEDWFRFTIAHPRRVVVTLGDLPVDGRLELVGACGSAVLATSNRTGTGYEELSAVLAAGTYRVRASFPTNGWSEAPYSLEVRAFTGPALKSATVTRGGTTVRVVGEALNATGATAGRVTVTARFRDAAGTVVGTLTGSTFNGRIADGAVSPFVLSGPMPAFTSVTYSVSVSSSAPSPARRLTLRTLDTTINPDGSVTERGSVRNTGAAAATSVTVARTWYDSRGTVLDVRIAGVSPTTLTPGAKGLFTVRRPALAGVQGARITFRGS